MTRISLVRCTTLVAVLLCSVAVMHHTKRLSVTPISGNPLTPITTAPNETEASSQAVHQDRELLSQLTTVLSNTEGVRLSSDALDSLRDLVQRWVSERNSTSSFKKHYHLNEQETLTKALRHQRHCESKGRLLKMVLPRVNSLAAEDGERSDLSHVGCLLCLQHALTSLVVSAEELKLCSKPHTACRTDSTNVGCELSEAWAAHHCRGILLSMIGATGDSNSALDVWLHQLVTTHDRMVRPIHVSRDDAAHPIRRFNEVSSRGFSSLGSSQDGVCSRDETGYISSFVGSTGNLTALFKRQAFQLLTEVVASIACSESERFAASEMFCLPPKLRALVTLAISQRWMFASGVAHRVPLWDVNDLVDLTTEAPHARTSTSFQWSFNLRDKKAASSSSARAKDIYFNLTNVAVTSSASSSGEETTFGGLTSVNVPGGKKKLDWIRDERFIQIRRLAVRERPASFAPPRFLVKRSTAVLYLFPVIFGSDNIGHVMFRYYSAVDLWKKLQFIKRREAMNVMEERRRVIVGYVVLPSAGTTFNTSKNMYRVFHDAFGSGWYSFLVGEPSDAGIGGASLLSRPGMLDIVFEEVIVGFGSTFMFHPRHIPNLESARKQSQEYLKEALPDTEEMLLACFGWPRNMTVRNASIPIRITIIVRKTRRLLATSDLVDYFQRTYLNRTTRTVKGGVLGGELGGRRAVAPVYISEVALEELTIREQIALAGSSDVWVGVAGTGLSWMMFMQPGSVVVEVQDPPIMRCTGAGINEERLFCDFSKQSQAKRLNHIGVVATHDSVNCTQDFLKCDVRLSEEAFSGALLAAVCSLGIQDENLARRSCAHLLRKK